MSVTEPEELIFLYSLFVLQTPLTTQRVLAVYAEVINLTNAHTHVLPLKYTKALHHSPSQTHKDPHKHTYRGCVSAGDRQTVRRSEK